MQNQRMTMIESGHSVKVDAAHLLSGIYFYRLLSGEYSAVKKMIMVK